MQREWMERRSGGERSRAARIQDPDGPAFVVLPAADQ
jgi:hypothetical protein